MSVSFEDFVLDPDSRELRRAGHAVPLTPKAYQLLELLVTNRPKALSKLTIQEHLWPNTFVVEKNLVNLIGEIRRSLRMTRLIHGSCAPSIGSAMHFSRPRLKTVPSPFPPIGHTRRRSRAAAFRVR